VQKRNAPVAARKNQIIELLLWLAGASVALAASILCLTVASDGKINAIALVPFVWTVAMFAGAVRAVPAAFWRAVLVATLRPLQQAIAVLSQHAEQHRPQETERQGQQQAWPHRRGIEARTPQMVFQLNGNTRAPEQDRHLVGAAVKLLLGGWIMPEVRRHALPQQRAG
jgi:hypothetical protein